MSVIVVAPHIFDGSGVTDSDSIAFDYVHCWNFFRLDCTVDHVLLELLCVFVGICIVCFIFSIEQFIICLFLFSVQAPNESRGNCSVVLVPMPRKKHNILFSKDCR